MDARPPPPLNYAAAVTNSDPVRAVLPRPEFLTYKGELAVKFPQPLIDHLAKPFRYALIGKFSQGRPNMEAIKHFMSLQNFAENFTLGLLDSKHVLFNFTGEKDYIRLYSKGLWQVTNKPMRVLKWMPDFRAVVESSIVPIGLSFPQLHVALMDLDNLSDIVSSFGRVLRVDAANLDFHRPSIAKVQVEIDLLKPIPHRIWIQLGDSPGYWKTIDIEEELPRYCIFCAHVGHDEQSCFIKHPELMPGRDKSRPRNAQNLRCSSRPALQYKILQRSDSLMGQPVVDGSQLVEHELHREWKAPMEDPQSQQLPNDPGVGMPALAPHETPSPAPLLDPSTSKQVQQPSGTIERQTKSPWKTKTHILGKQINPINQLPADDSSLDVMQPEDDKLVLGYQSSSGSPLNLVHQDESADHMLEEGQVTDGENHDLDLENDDTFTFEFSARKKKDFSLKKPPARNHARNRRYNDK